MDIYDAGTAFWSAASLSRPRYKAAGASVSSFALFAGGEDHSNPFDTVDIFDSADLTWDTTTLSDPRRDLAGTSVGPHAIFAGGQGQVAVTDRVDIFTIPEPTTMSLLALGALALLRRQR